MKIHKTQLRTLSIDHKTLKDHSKTRIRRPVQSWNYRPISIPSREASFILQASIEDDEDSASLPGELEDVPIMRSSSSQDDTVEDGEADQEDKENAEFEKLILTGGDFDDIDAEWEILNKKLKPIRKSYFDGSAYNSFELPPTPIKKAEDFPYDPLPELRMSLESLLEQAQMPEEAKRIKEEFGEIILTGLQSEPQLVKTGELYFAYSTARRNGVDEIPTAIANGAVAIITQEEEKEDEHEDKEEDEHEEERKEEEDGEEYVSPETTLEQMNTEASEETSTNHIAFISVPNINEMMSRLGCVFYEYPSSKMKVIAINGSSGKTSVAWILRSILHEFGASTGMMSDTEYSINYDLLEADGELFVPDEEDPAHHRVAATPYHLLPFKGRYLITEPVPDPLQVQRVLASMVHRGAHACVMECPTQVLVELRLYHVAIDLALFLNLESFPGEPEEMFKEEKEVIGEFFSNLKIPEGQRAIVNIDDESAQEILDASKEVPVVTYSLKNPSADVWCESVSYTIWESEMIISTPLGKMQIITPLIGEPHVHNILASVASAIGMDIELPQIVAGIEALDAVPGRCQVIDEGQEFSVVIDNADTPHALKSLIRNIRACSPKRLFLVFGCTQDHCPETRAEMGSVAYYEADIVLITTDSPGLESPDEVISDIVAGFPKDLLDKTELWVMDPWQDPGRVPWWFEQWLFQAQSEVRRHIVEDRSLAIRGAIGTARKDDVVLITGRGSRDFSVWLDKADEPLLTWFDDKTEVDDALFKLPHLLKSQVVTDKLPWAEPKDTTTDRKRNVQM